MAHGKANAAGGAEAALKGQDVPVIELLNVGEVEGHAAAQGEGLGGVDPRVEQPAFEVAFVVVKAFGDGKEAAVLELGDAFQAAIAGCLLEVAGRGDGGWG